MRSQPGSPEGENRMRPQSMYSINSPEIQQKQRPQSILAGRSVRSNSRMSMASSRPGTRLSDEEAKASVRVAVRVRPPLGPSDPGSDLIPQRFQRSAVEVTTPTSLSVESPQGRKIFIFDRVFGADVSQKGVWDYLEDSVDSFLEGYNVSILAYGQSGAGKSHTMGTSGPEEQSDPSSMGIIPRAANHLFASLQGKPLHSRQNSGLSNPANYTIGNLNSVLQHAQSANSKSWTMSVTYVEMYNEQPRDLLLPESTPVHERASVQIREDTKGRILIEGLKSVPIKSAEELMAVLNHGSSIRQTDATIMNSKSSRSHAVFTINLRQTKQQNLGSPSKNKHTSLQFEAASNNENVILESKLHFVDLAGSERLKNTGATGDRAKEGIWINAGLASLGKVISQLSSRSSGGHVSYRDSKLTRMLQDSLGGNAITYVVACVTPAEFHLSETLNTVQYAQRARNIQSKPRIQQLMDEADKQAIIDRLKSEVSFLRQQIHSSDGVDRRNGTSTERQDRPQDIEMQNQLLDVQLSYKNLSERHAKLVSELATSNGIGDVGHEKAADRLKRSQENQQAIEHMVLEYEKTIATLENNLSTTRSALSTTESDLLERETKCAYIETMNQQLNARLQKLMDRENNTDSYLRELEGRLQDQTSGGEKHDATIADLRREIARVRESETNTEDYVCTLEERLAEASQDIENVQREVERLEQLVERQRSLGKLDNLIYELDHVQRDGPSSPSHNAQLTTPARTMNVNGHRSSSQTEPMRVLREAEEIELPTEDENELIEPAIAEQLSASESDEAGLQALQNAKSKAELLTGRRPIELHSTPAQAKYVHEKFEAVSQELFDLRLEHESTVNNLDLLSAKYQEALRTLAEMQDHLDEIRHTPAHTSSPEDLSRPQSFLNDTRNHDLRHQEQIDSTLSLSSELSMAGESTTSAEHMDMIPTTKEVQTSEFHGQEIGRLQKLLADHENNLRAMKQQYSQLEQEHTQSMNVVERLKSEAQRSRSPMPPSPAPGMIRRSTSQIGSSVDRGQRAIVAIRTMLAEEFETQPHRLESLELHLSAANYELQSRLDRVQSLESEIKNTKKEMDMKSTIISGLTRERNSLKGGTPVDLSMISQMRDQLIHKETELKSLHDGYARREQELQAEINQLQTAQRSVTQSPAGQIGGNEDKVRELQDELEKLSSQQQSVHQALAEREKRLTMTVAELEAALASVETLKAQNSSSTKAIEDDHNMSVGSTTSNVMQIDHERYEEEMTRLKRELERQTFTNSEHVQKISDLTAMHEAASNDAHDHSRIIQTQAAEIKTYKVQIREIQSKIQEAEAAVEFHKHGLKSLHDAHAREIEEMKLSHADLLTGYDDKLIALNAEYQQKVNNHTRELDQRTSTLQGLVKGAENILGHPTSADMLLNHVRDMAEQKEHLSETNKRLVGVNTELEAQLTGRQSLKELEEAIEAANVKISNYQDTIRNLANEVGNHEETIRDKEAIIKKHEATIESISSENQKRVTLIEELEQQLQSSFEQHHNRVSVIQAHGNQALVEAQQRISQLEKEVQRVSLAESDPGSRSNTMKSLNRPRSPMETNNRSNSMTSNLRKSASIASLPSPPPAIPLPPLPTLPTLPGISVGAINNSSPPQSRDTLREGSAPVPLNATYFAQPVTPVSAHTPTIASAPAFDTHTIRRQSAIIEDQESRLRTIEKHLHAEKQLTASLEEALVDLETQSQKLRLDAEGWKKKCGVMEEEMQHVRQERRMERLSVQAVEDAVKKRRAAEEARAQLEERMRVLSASMGGEKKKRSRNALNCF